jgi:hypothetical protein
MNKKNFLRFIKFVFLLIVLFCLLVLFIRNYIEIIEQGKSVSLRVGTDEKIQSIVSKSDNIQEIAVIQNFTWKQLYKNKLFESRYTYYCRCISAVIILAVKKDNKVIPYFKDVIKKYIESPNIVDGNLFEIYVWGLLYIEGKPAFIWLKKTFNRNLSFPAKLKNRLMTNAQYLLWLDEYENCQEQKNVPNFLNDIQLNINIYDPDWVIRFYCQYCKFYNISHFRNFADWHEHFRRQENIVTIPSYKEAMFFKSWYILINIINKNHSASIINVSRNTLTTAVDSKNLTGE